MIVEKYIGVRLSFEEIRTLLNRSVSRLNNSMSEHIRSVALERGLNKTLRGRRLEFYVVTEEEYNKLISPKMKTWAGLKNVDFRPLICVDRSQSQQVVANVNSQYPSRMNSELFRKYQKQMREELSLCVEILDNDGRRKSRVIDDQQFNDLFCIGQSVVILQHLRLTEQHSDHII